MNSADIFTVTKAIGGQEPQSRPDARSAAALSFIKHRHPAISQSVLEATPEATAVAKSARAIHGVLKYWALATIRDALRDLERDGLLFGRLVPVRHGGEHRIYRRAS